LRFQVQDLPIDLFGSERKLNGMRSVLFPALDERSYLGEDEAKLLGLRIIDRRVLCCSS